MLIRLSLTNRKIITQISIQLCWKLEVFSILEEIQIKYSNFNQ